MSSIFSTQNRHTFLRRKYCFLVASALSPPVGRMDPLMGRPPRCSAMLFSYLFGYGSARHRCSGSGTSGFGGDACHRMFQRDARSGRWRWFASSTLFTFLLALLDLLQLFVDADALKLHHQVRHAQAAFNLENRFGLGCELEQYIEAFGALLHSIGQLANAPFVGLVDIAPLSGNERSQLFDQMIDLFFRRIGPENKQLFVDP